MIKKIYCILFILFFITLPCFGENYQEMGSIIKSILDDTAVEDTHKKSKIIKKKKKNNKAVLKNQPAETKDKKTRAQAISMSKPDEVLFKTGIQLYNAGAHKESLVRLNRLVNEYQKSPYLQSARIYISKNLLKEYQYSKAIEILSMIPDDSGVYPAALFEIGEAWILKGNRLKAVDYFQKLSSLFPGHELADNALLKNGGIFHFLKKGHQAAESSVKIIQNYSKKETVDDAYFLLGKIFETDPELKDMETAAEFYRLFLKKAAKGEPQFINSPLRDRVRRNLNSIEKNHLRLK